MGVARWYPTVITLQDGLTIIAGGSTAEGGGYGSDSSLNEPTYQVSNSLVLATILVNLSVMICFWLSACMFPCDLRIFSPIICSVIQLTCLSDSMQSMQCTVTVRACACLVVMTFACSA